MTKEQLTSILLNESNWGEYKVEDTRTYPTIVAMYGNTSNCKTEIINPALKDFSQRTNLSVGVLEVDLSLATNYDEAVKIWKEQVETYGIQSKNVIILHGFTKLPAIFGSDKLEGIISSWLGKAVVFDPDDNGWTGWHLIMIDDENTNEWITDSCWTYFNRKGCLDVYKL